MTGNPKILALVCSWHPLTSADNAGEDRRAYGTGTTIVSVDCAGVVTSASILKALSGKADGVLVAACGRGDCHYVNGNESCEGVIEKTHALMDLAGIPRARLRLDLSSEVEGEHFVALINEFSDEVLALNGSGRRRAPRRKAKASAKKAKPKASPKKTKAAKKPKASQKKTKAAEKTSKTSAKRKRSTKRTPKTSAKRKGSTKKTSKTSPKRKRSTKAGKKRTGSGR